MFLARNIKKNLDFESLLHNQKKNVINPIF